MPADVTFDPSVLDAKRERRDVTFYDTRSVHLLQRGILLRAPRARRDADDVTVKLRPMVPKRVDPSLHDHPRSR